ncbi:hypothetical protein ACHAWF_009987 [Thalassiosira exigua]
MTSSSVAALPQARGETRSKVDSSMTSLIAPSDRSNGTTDGRSLHHYVAKVAEEEKQYFRESLPPSLRQNVSHPGRDDVAPLKEDEVVIGKKLGSGEFSNVYEVKSFRMQADIRDALLSNDDHAKRLHLKKTETFRQTNKPRYAVKHIKQTYLHEKGSEAYAQAAVDLTLEAEILANIDHPNIVKLRGLTSSGAAGFESGPCGYFLVIDHLYEILDQRIRRWHGPSTSPAKRGRVSKMIMKGANSITKRNTKTKANDGGGLPLLGKGEIMDQCLSAALQISAALAYLHERAIIFRDLKPENIGFDVRGDVKIFDFGLARVMPEGGDPYCDWYEMSGAGSPRYMAPELLSGERYNLKADVYTFATVLWEMLTGEQPYSFVRSKNELTRFVVKVHGRPEIDESWPSEVQHILRNSFDADMDKRPEMGFFHNTIRNVLMTLRGGDSEGLTDSFIGHRRTAQSMNRFTCASFNPEDLLEE